MNRYIFFQRYRVITFICFSFMLTKSPFVLLAADATNAQNPFAENPPGGNEAPLPDLNSILHPVTEPTPNLIHNTPEEPGTFLYTFPKTSDPTPVVETVDTIFDTATAERNELKAEAEKTILINFNDVSMIEYVRFVSRLSNRNFIFDDNDLQFNVTIVSEQPATVENIMTALIQELRIHSLSLIQDGNNFIIHKNNKVNNISQIASRAIPGSLQTDATIITRVFLLNTLDPEKAAALLRPMSSDQAIVEALPGSNYLIITDIASNIEKITQLIRSIDAPNSGVVIGQYQSAATPIDALIPLAEKIMLPISQNQVLVFVPHTINNSVFIVASPFLVARSIAIFKHIEEENVKNGILDLTNSDIPSEESLNASKTPTIVRMPYGNWVQNDLSNWVFQPIQSQPSSNRPSGKWEREYDGAWQFIPGEEGALGAPTPEGKWVRNKDGYWIYELTSKNPSIGRGPTGNFPTEFSPNELFIDKTGGSITRAPVGEWTPNELINSLPKNPSVIRMPTGEWIENETNHWIFKPSEQTGSDRFNPPPGNWQREYDGSWQFVLGENGGLNTPSPKGRWVRDQNGYWVYELFEEEPFNPNTLTRGYPGGPKIVVGAPKVTKFIIEKLKYRKGDSVQPILRQIASTIQKNERGNEDLILALQSVEWLNTTNSLVFSGTVESLDRVRALIKEIDIPMRQVFIEMLILETTLGDTLDFGVSYATRFGGGDVSGSQGFLGGENFTSLRTAIATAGLTPSTPTAIVPNATNFIPNNGFNLGVVGQTITHCGTEFGSIGALIHALHTRSCNKIVSHPKLLIEDGGQAELFVGQNTPYRTQSISNDNGDVVTSNFEYRDVGTLLRVTPYIGNGDIISLDIQEEVSVIISELPGSGAPSNTSPGPTTQLNRTVTRVHIPDEYFLIISGMLQNQETITRDQVPCLGGVPLLGGLFSDKRDRDDRRNLMIFIRPKIIDTEEEINNVTKRQQDVYDYNNELPESSEYEASQWLDLFNLNPTLHPEGGCGCFE